MKRGRLVSAIALAAGIPAALGTSLALTASASPAHPNWYSEQRVVIDCLPKPLVQPGDYTLTCADGNSLLSGLHWTSWTPELASASGTYQQDDCTPNCAEGHFHSYPVLVVFWGSAPVKGHPGEQQYTEMTRIFPGARPPYYNDGHLVTGPVTITGALPTGYPGYPA